MNAATWTELGAGMIDWLDGKRSETASHGGTPDPETAEIADALRRINRAGVVTLGSQPGVRGIAHQQRAFLDAFGDLDRIMRIAGDLRFDGFWVLARPLGAPASGRALPVTTRFGGTCTFLCDPQSLDETVGWELEDADPALAERCGILSVADPEWGRKDALWRAVERAIKRHPGGSPSDAR